LEAQLSEGVMVSLFVTRTQDGLCVVMHSPALGDHTLRASGEQFDRELGGAFLALRQQKRSSALLEQMRDTPTLPAPAPQIAAVKASGKASGTPAPSSVFPRTPTPAQSAANTTATHTQMPVAPLQDHSFDDLM